MRWRHERRQRSCFQQQMSGRASAPASHYWYRIDGEVQATAKLFQDVGAAASAIVFIELRSTGCPDDCAALDPSEWGGGALGA